MTGVCAAEATAAEGGAERVWVERLQLTNFRNYAQLTLNVGPNPVVLAGANGAGKTNLLEALSLLSPGQGLRRAPYAALARAGSLHWAVAARVHAGGGAIDFGTGVAPAGEATETHGRRVRINGENGTASGALAAVGEVLWLTPSMDGLFGGPAADRRRFLDRLVACCDPHYRTLLSRYGRAMQHRNRLLAEEVREAMRFAGLEQLMAETGVAIAAARCSAVAELAAAIGLRRDGAPDAAFPWAELRLAGTLEGALALRAAIDVEDGYLLALARGRERDRAAGRTLEGPHRSDLLVGHGPKGLPAASCSTGEQKALLTGLILAHADLVARRARAAPILLLDEVTAHLDAARRASLFQEVLALGGQTWMSGSDSEAFSTLAGRAQMLRVEEGRIAGLG
jgi:DNA replication and repair protein RecF